jgi:tRNA(Ile)-lysidine synthase
MSKPLWSQVKLLANWVDLEHRLWQSLEKNALLEKKILVGFSGGADSLALLWALHRVKKQNIVACYVHHGDSQTASLKNYRQGAAKFCEDFCKKYQIPFELRQRKTLAAASALKEDQVFELTSEESLRDFRYEAFESVMQQTGADLLALAHHQDDLLETRILRLVRGTGEQGLQAMRVLQGPLFRPFLKTSKASLENYLTHCSLTAFEDPSNLLTAPLRNWLRQEWLPALEARQPGALQSFARSLEVLASSADAAITEDALINAVFVNSKTLTRLGFLALSDKNQKKILARFVLSQNKRDFTHGHIEEVLKRLDNPQKELRFRVGGVDWYVNAQQISIQS